MRLCEGIGLIDSHFLEADGYILRGAKIKNIIYGTITSISSNKLQNLTSFNLLQNYPNPFNPSTEIKYSIKEAGNVLLKIYNSLGQEVKTLVDKFQSPGEYIVKLNATGFASGIYFYGLQTGNYDQVRKMILSK